MHLHSCLTQNASTGRTYLGKQGLMSEANCIIQLTRADATLVLHDRSLYLCTLRHERSRNVVLSRVDFNLC
jgi:hypothetical protein